MKLAMHLGKTLGIRGIKWSVKFNRVFFNVPAESVNFKRRGDKLTWQPELCLIQRQ